MSPIHKNARKASGVLVALFFISSSTNAFSDDPSTLTGAESRPAILGRIEEQGIKILGEMKVPGGLRGFAAKAGAQPLTIYLTPDNQHVIVGPLVDGDGIDVAADQLKKLSEVAIDPAVWTTLEKSSWVQDGNPEAPRVIYTFTDPNCPYCRQFWKAARPWVEGGKVQLRHVMVGVIRQDSPAKAAAILEAQSPEKAIVLNETQEGGIPPLSTIRRETAVSLKANEQLMTALGFGGTPAIVYKNGKGEIKTMSGLPQGGGLDEVLGPK
ncbi:thiol:disulfide interchange protein DsbG [Agrobacterium sp. ICMP 6402]|uniref:thiol:disulfide interchange protein DsbG n=1 Tax=Agrobacterium sp. ICMP 6402 TaxID=2292443 RepID=UPI001294A267|nr:thiol:disulfide interchange protein DsbG [Agrobacterium sp. ICMP 6402]MQB13169.1 thiol:disulfide interchange protein DsbG [Agrobacterium sp. ICMP 6402]